MLIYGINLSLQISSSGQRDSGTVGGLSKNGCGRRPRWSCSALSVDRAMASNTSGRLVMFRFDPSAREFSHHLRISNSFAEILATSVSKNRLRVDPYQGHRVGRTGRGFYDA